MKTNSTTKTVELPVRLAWLYGSKATVMRGTKGSHGDAGWTTIHVDAAGVDGFMRRNPAAAMPAWKRLGYRAG